MKWTEALIRKEIERLDKITGLNGNDLIVEFFNSERALGCFVIKNGKSDRFRFSRVFFDSDAFAVRQGYETIRHEYAHFMDHELFGNSSDGVHGSTWKDCCRMIGAKPCVHYNSRENDAQILSERLQAEHAQKRANYSCCFNAGERIAHPTLGTGTIMSITPSSGDARLDVCFDSGVKKLISASWLSAKGGVVS